MAVRSVTPVIRIIQTISLDLQKTLINRRYIHSSISVCQLFLHTDVKFRSDKVFHNSIRCFSDERTNTADNKEGSEKFEFMAETKKLLNIVAKSLYSDKHVFLRELISNCSDSLEKLRHLQVAGNDTIENPDTPLGIKIITDPSSHKLIIEDTGVGMTRQEMIDYLGTIARSSNKAFVDELQKSPEKISESDNVIGMFGVGFYSAFMVADLVEVYSKSWIQGSKCHHWSSKGVGMYEIKEVQESNTVRGTKIILHLKDNSWDFAKNSEVKSIIIKYSNFVQFPIHLDGKIANMQTPLWSLEPKAVTDDQHKEFYKFLSGNTDEPLYILHFKIDMPINLTGLFYIPGIKNLLHISSSIGNFRVSLYSRRVLIQEETSKLLPNWMKFMFGVVDSEDIPLNLSREMLQDHMLIANLKRVLISRIIKALKEESAKNRNRFKLFFDILSVYFREGVMVSETQADKEDIASLYLYDSSKTSKGESTNFTEYIENMPPTQKDIYYLVSSDKIAADNSPYVESLKRLSYEVLYSYSEHDNVILSYLREFKGKKIVSAEEYALNNPNSLKKTTIEGQKHKDFIRWFESVLAKYKVKSVNISTSLQKQPAMITFKDITQAKTIARHQDFDFSSDLFNVTIHINIYHQLIINIDRLRQKDAELAELLANQVYFNCLVAAGLIRDARSILHNITDVLVATTQEASKNTILTP